MKTFIESSLRTVTNASRIALGDLFGNITLYKDGLLSEKCPCIMAGINYGTPWTRDTAINTWNCAGLLLPETAKNTLLAVLEKRDDKIVIGDQYWDAIIWSIGAWWYYLYTGDRDFLRLAHEATKNSIAFFEETEFSQDFGLFRGPACYGDGVSAYPDVYAQTNGSSSILDWPMHNSSNKAPTGYGIPIHSLSTNCLYHEAYRIVNLMSLELGVSPTKEYEAKRVQLNRAIQKYLWDPSLGHFRYIADKFGGSEYQEGIGHSLAILFNIATAEQTRSILQNQHITNSGIPCVWPTFKRYSALGQGVYGRHSGTVWPHIQALWGCASLAEGNRAHFDKEFFRLTEFANRDFQFTEIYHPDNGMPYGGVQEDIGKGIRSWHSCGRQTWSATGYLRMILHGICGLNFSEKGIRFTPYLPDEMSAISVSGVPYRKMILTVNLTGKGTTVESMHINGAPSSALLLDSAVEGECVVDIKLK